MKKILAIALSILMIFSLFACKGTDDGKDSKTGNDTSESKNDVFEPTDKKIEVSWFTPWWMQSSDYDYIFDDFARKNPGYTIERNDIGDLPTLLAAIQAGTAPDVFMGGDPNQTDFTSGCYQSLFSNLDEYLEKDNDVNLKNLDKTQMSLCKFINGSYYSLPYLTSQFCLVYNKSILSKAGYDRPPETWTELYDYAKKLTTFDSNGIVNQMGIIDGPWGYQMETLNKTNGSLAANGIDGAFNSDWNLYVNEYCGRFEQILGGSSTKPKDVQFSIENNNAAMSANGNLNFLNSYAESGVDFNIAQYPRPDDVDEQVTPALLWYYFTIPRTASNPNGGWKFIKYCMTDGQHATVSEDYNKNPDGFFPQYIAHNPTRERVYDDFKQYLPDNKQKILEKRDELASGSIYIMPASPMGAARNNITEKWNEKTELSLKDRLSGIQQEYQSTLQVWKKEMEGRGWKFQDGKTPTLPDDYK